MTQAIVMREFGGPEVLGCEAVTVPAPGPGEIRLRHSAIGVNFHDVYVRSGAYRTLSLPGIPGIEGAGVVEQVGAGVQGLQVGDRVAYATQRYGAYAAERLLPAALAIKLPEGLDETMAAASFLKGLTAEMLVCRVHAVQAGQIVLVHAAAGAVGQLLCQWACRLGAIVIGTVGGQEKAGLAREAGCAHTIDYRHEDFVERVRDITQGAGVHVVYDAVGADTFDGSLDCLRSRGHLVSYGQASGPVLPLDIARLMPRSLSLTRPSIFDHTSDAALYRAMAQATFAAFADGSLRPVNAQVFALRDAPQAHQALASRQRTGAIVLRP